MAATVSPWSKPGAWALDSEEHEAELLEEQQKKDSMEPLADFPSLTAAAAAATKPKKKKGQTLSLAEFTTYGGPKPQAQRSEPVGLTHEDRLALPKGPRERSAEELDRSRGFKSYGDRGNRYSDRNGGDESSNSRWGSSRGSDRNGSGFNKEANRDSGPSRADEVDNWASEKKPLGGLNGFERRDRDRDRDRDRGGFFSDSQSKADESDNWVSNKSFVPSDGRRFERERKSVGFTSNGGGGADSDYWGKKKEESNGVTGNESSGIGSGRPRLNLQPRTLPVVSNGSSPGSGTANKPKNSNPFGEARPREEVLAEKGQDWKKIDEQLGSVKIKEVNEKAEGGSSIGKKAFGLGNGRYSSPNDRTEKSWRKPDTEDAGSERDAGGSERDAGSESAEKIEKNENEPAEEN